MSATRRFFQRWWPALLAVCLIALESSSLFSSHNTGGLLRAVIGWWASWSGVTVPWSLETLNVVLRKTGHFIGYGLVSLTFLRGWRLQRHFGAPSVWQRHDVRGIALALGSTLLLASADEWHQSTLPDRGGSPWDVALDMAGACTTQGLLWLYAVVRYR